MTKPLIHVHPRDAGAIEGEANSSHPSLKLYYAIREIAGTDSDRLYDAISKKYSLGFVNASDWAVKMNAAIAIWNQYLPQSAGAIAEAYGV